MSVVSRCIQLTLLRGDIRVLVDMCVPTGSHEKKGPSIWVEVVRILRWGFFLAPGSPYFQACLNCSFSQRFFGRLLFLYLFILFRIYFYFYIFDLLVFYFLFNRTIYR